VASSPGSPLPHFLGGHRKLVGCSAIPACSCPGPVRCLWGSIVELEVPPNEMLELMTFHPHNTNVLQGITCAKSPYPTTRCNPGQKTNVFDTILECIFYIPHSTSMASPSRQHNFAVRVSHKCIVTVVEFGRSRQRSTLGMLGSWRFGVWALPP